MFMKAISVALVAFTVQTGFAFQQGDHPGKIDDDSALVAAVQSRKRVRYVEAGNVVATKLLPDDNKGLRHQKWEAQLSDGNVIQVIYNVDMVPRVPIQVGDKFGVGGEYIPSGRTGIIHWLHDDPKGLRPDGYVYLNGVVYGDLNQRH